MSTRLYVHDKNKRAVPAKYLEINGEVIRDPSGTPYIVPADFDWNTYMGKFETFKHSLEAWDNAEPSLPDEGTRAMRDSAEVYGFLIGQFHAAWPASPSDIQRTYNGYSGKGEGDFVPAFRPAASFLLGPHVPLQVSVKSTPCWGEGPRTSCRGHGAAGPSET